LHSTSALDALMDRKMIPRRDLGDWADRLRAEGRVLVTLNGCFDLLHMGHFDLLYRASTEGDHLLVLLNTDEYIRSRKGAGRPVHSLDERLLQIAALEMVDAVSWFPEEDPCKALEEIAPDVHVNGNDYGQECAEAAVIKRQGGRLVIAPLLEGYSSSDIVERARTCG